MNQATCRWSGLWKSIQGTNNWSIHSRNRGKYRHDPFTNPPGGSMGVFTDKESAEDFIGQDPFIKEGIVGNNIRYNKSKVYFIPDPQGLGIDSMGELATTFELSKQFLDENGNPAPFKDITETLENAFNFVFGNAYKSKSRVFNRKPYNLTKALDYLKKLLIRESRDKKIVKR